VLRFSVPRVYSALSHRTRRLTRLTWLGGKENGISMGSTKVHYTVLHTESSLGWGGQEKRIFSEAEVMRQRGHTILLAADFRSELYHRGKEAGFALFPLTFGGCRNLAACLSLRQVLRRQRVEILNTHSSLDSWVGHLAAMGRRDRVKLVRTRHLSTPIRSSWPTRWLYQSPDAIITTGQAIKELIAKRVGVAEHKIYSIPTGVPLDRFYPHPSTAGRAELLPAWPRDACIIGSVAVLRTWKGHNFLLEAVAKILAQEEKVYLVLVGDGPIRHLVEEKVAALNLNDHVLLTGYQDDVPAWLALMDIVVLASYANEGVPQSLLQAMAMARPVIGTTCGGIPEIVTDGVNGLLTPPKDPEALTQALIQLIRNPVRRQEFGLNGLRLVQERFSLEQMAAAMEQVYEHILAE